MLTDALRESRFEEALTKFEEVVSGEKALGGTVEYGFKALRQIVIMLIGRGDLAPATTHYASLLGMLSEVTANDANDAVDAVLEAMSGAASSGGTVPSSLADVRQCVYWFGNHAGNET